MKAMPQALHEASFQRQIKDIDMALQACWAVLSILLNRIPLTRPKMPNETTTIKQITTAAPKWP